MNSIDALTGKEFTATVYVYDTNGNLISTQTKKKQFPYYVNDNSRLTFDGICSLNLTLKDYEYHKKPDNLGSNQNYIAGYSTVFDYEITLNDQYEYQKNTVTRFYHIYDWIKDDESDMSSKDFEIWQDFIRADEGGYQGERSMTENSPDEVIDQRIFTDFRFTIYLTKKDRVPTYLPVRNDSGVIVRHYSTNVIFRDE